MIVLDHTPLLLSCQKFPVDPKRLRFENFWLHNRGTHDLIEHAWTMQQEGNQAEIIHCKLHNMLLVLSRWHSDKFAHSCNQLEQCKKAIIFFDQIEKRRYLTPGELLLRIKNPKEDL
jgi:hypothetical protein